MPAPLSVQIADAVVAELRAGQFAPAFVPVRRLLPVRELAELDELRAREALAAGPIPLYLGRLASMLKERGGRYFAGDRLSVADFKVFLWTRHLQSGQLDHIPKDIVQRLAPKLAEHFQRISALPEIVDYYKKRASA